MYLFCNKNGPPNPLLTTRRYVIWLIAFSCPHVDDDKQIIMSKKKVVIVCLLTQLVKVSFFLFVPFGPATKPMTMGGQGFSKENLGIRATVVSS